MTSLGDGVITIGDQSFSFNNSKGHWFKIVVRDGILTMTDDSLNNNDGGETVIRVALDDSVLSGEVGLSIDFQFTAWSQVECTDMYLAITPSDII